MNLFSFVVPPEDCHLITETVRGVYFMVLCVKIIIIIIRTSQLRQNCLSVDQFKFTPIFEWTSTGNFLFCNKLIIIKTLIKRNLLEKKTYD